MRAGEIVFEAAAYLNTKSTAPHWPSPLEAPAGAGRLAALLRQALELTPRSPRATSCTLWSMRE